MQLFRGSLQTVLYVRRTLVLCYLMVTESKSGHEFDILITSYWLVERIQYLLEYFYHLRTLAKHIYRCGKTITYVIQHVEIMVTD